MVVVREKGDTYTANTLNLTNGVIVVLFEYVLLHLLHCSKINEIMWSGEKIWLILDDLDIVKSSTIVGLCRLV